MADSKARRLAGEIYEAAERFRRELLRGEQQASAELARRYGELWRRVQGRVDDLTARLEQERQAAAAAGRPFSPTEFQIYQQQRLDALRREVEREVQALARFADAQTRRRQAQVIEAAQRQAERYVQMQLAELEPGQAVRFGRLHKEAFKDLVGFTQNGSPLRALLDTLPGQAGEAVANGLILGIGLGQNPGEIARALSRELGGSLARLMTICRTEVLRAFREANLRSYRENSDLVGGWMWVAQPDTRTCAACWALHGTVHSLEERLTDHPNGRCAPAPITRTWAELGVDRAETTTPIPSGAELFEQLPETDKIKILGVSGYAAYAEGAVTLQDFVGVRYSAQWGETHYARSLREILGAEDALKWRGRSKR